MTLTISSIFAEPGFEFSISHKTIKVIRDKLRKDIIPKCNFDKVNGDYFLGLIISTNGETRIVDVKGPAIDKRNKYINWGLWLPFYEITSSSNQLHPFIAYLFDALIIVFSHYNISKDDINSIRQEIESEIEINPGLF